MDVGCGEAESLLPSARGAGADEVAPVFPTVARAVSLPDRPVDDDGLGAAHALGGPRLPRRARRLLRCASEMSPVTAVRPVVVLAVSACLIYGIAVQAGALDSAPRPLGKRKVGGPVGVHGAVSLAGHDAASAAAAPPPSPWSVLSPSSSRDLASDLGGGVVITSSGGRGSGFSRRPAPGGAVVLASSGGAPAVAATAVSSSGTVATASRGKRTSGLRAGGGKPSLYCFMLSRTGTYEVELTFLQYDLRTGIFGCDEHDVFSNENFGTEDRKGINFEVLSTSLAAPIGGMYTMALNTKIFLHLWHRVFESGAWRRNDWSVKLDPDAVFLPERLRVVVSDKVVREAASRTSGVMLNNCRSGNHGPLEVISRNAVSTFHIGVDDCVKANYAPFDEIGEDVFVRRCLKHRGVEMLDRFELLSEINCFENPNDCTSGKVAFHPLKQGGAFRTCWRNAERASR